MGLQSAKEFVNKMKEDKVFRKQVSTAQDKETFWALVQRENFSFDEHHLAGAMAACMTEMEGLA